MGVALLFPLSHASALTLNFADGVPAVSNTPWITCQRDNDGDVCQTRAYCSPGVKDSSSPIYSDAWADFQASHAGWSLVNGGALEGTLTITKFAAYSACPDNQGAEIRATFEPKGADPVDWRWSQGLYAPKGNGEHDGAVPAMSSFMDCDAADGNNDPPLYPYSYPDGHFYDKPGRQCIDSSTVSWVGVALISTADFAAKKLTTYEGIIWGFDVECKPVPEPLTLTGLGVGLAVLLRRRRRI